MKVILVSQSIEFHESRSEKRDSTDQNLIKLLYSAGYLSFPISNKMMHSKRKMDTGSYLARIFERVNPNGILLSGGTSIGENPDRDHVELELLRLAELQQLPVLGLCRGMQVMAKKAGSKLIPIKNHVKTQHLIEGNISGIVNSFHKLTIDDCPDGYTVLARSTDNSIEAIKHKSLGWEGWMWHPEREPKFRRSDLQRIKSIYS